MIPRGLVFECPSCNAMIEGKTNGWSLTSGEGEKTGPGIILEMVAFAPHECEGMDS